MKTNIITPSEVVAVAFSDGAYLPPEVIAEEDIAVAVERWIKPVVGEGVLQAVAEVSTPNSRATTSSPLLLTTPACWCSHALIVPPPLWVLRWWVPPPSVCLPTLCCEDLCVASGSVPATR